MPMYFSSGVLGPAMPRGLDSKTPLVRIPQPAPSPSPKKVAPPPFEPGKTLGSVMAALLQKALRTPPPPSVQCSHLDSLLATPAWTPFRARDPTRTMHRERTIEARRRRKQTILEPHGNTSSSSRPQASQTLVRLPARTTWSAR